MTKSGEPESKAAISIVYRNIHIYRLLLNVIYGGSYRSRFADVTRHLRGRKSVLELCFGDTWIARHCRDNDIEWTGYDLNQSFVSSARKAGFIALCTDVLSEVPFPRNEITIIQGSLYHFHDSIDALFAKIFQSTDDLLVSEPVRNFSSAPGLIGWIARRSANVGKGHEQFRYNKESLLQMAARQAGRVGCTCSVLAEKRDMTLLFKRTPDARRLKVANGLAAI